MKATGFMSLASRILCLCVVAAVSAGSSEGREWTDATGKFHWRADLFAASEELAILRERDGDLHAVQVSELSEADQGFVKKYLEDDSRVSQDVHNWTMASGLKVKGTVLAYKSGPVEFEYKNGTPYVNGKRFRQLDPVYQKMVIKLVAETEDPSVETEADYKKWARALRRQKRTVQVDGVLMQLQSGQEYSIPMFLFSRADRSVLEAGWQQWSDEEATRQQQAQQDALLRAEAEDYQRRSKEAEQREQEEKEQDRRIQMMQLGLLAVDAGLTSIWEVQMAPGPGVYGRPMRVVVPANDSIAAQQAALQQHPGYVVGPTRQLSIR